MQPSRADILRHLEENRGRSQYRHAPSAGYAVNRVVRPLGRKFGPGAKALQSQWASIVGPQWASLSKPVSMRSVKGVTTLTILAKGPAAALMSANSPRLLEQINQFLGAEAVQKIKLRQGLSMESVSMNSPPTQDPNTAPLQKQVVLSAPSTLSEALDELGKKVCKP